MSFKRRPTRELELGNVKIGSTHPISIQSMTTAHTREVEKCIQQIIGLETAGCEIVRVAVFNMEDARAIGQILPRIRIPLVADIHFDYKLALAALEEGVDGLRINPGNIGSRDRVEAVVEKAAENNIPIRIGINGGSLEKQLLSKYGKPTAEAMLESALGHIRILEELDYHNIKVSLKSSEPLMTVESNRLFANECDYPIHLGVTEAGPPVTGAIKSAAALSLLLAEGIGDTIRISLTADPVEEIRAAKTLLESLGLRKQSLRVVSCPTCGRCQSSDMIGLANRIEKRLSAISEPLTIAVMGCAVNGPGEAKEADLGVACGKERGLIFKKGEKQDWVDFAEIEETLVKEAFKMAKEKSGN